MVLLIPKKWFTNAWGSRSEVAARNYSGDVNAVEDDREQRLVLPEDVPREALEPPWMQ
jgi:hypothetical protein